MSRATAPLEKGADLAWADEQLAEALHDLSVGRVESGVQWVVEARKIVHALARKQQGRWWNRWAASRASDAHLRVLRGRQ